MDPVCKTPIPMPYLPKLNVVPLFLNQLQAVQYSNGLQSMKKIKIIFLYSILYCIINNHTFSKVRSYVRILSIKDIAYGYI